MANEWTSNRPGPACPMPDDARGEHITLAHGEGGRLMRRLLRDHILPPLANRFLSEMSDGVVLPQSAGPIVFTTDSFVVTPLFFPGGDIGSLAVNGTINDLAVSGAKPLWLSLALIIEEGLSLSTLTRIIQSIAQAAKTAEIQIVTGDTKVVPRGAADGLFINTAGIGQLFYLGMSAADLLPGDRLLVTGPIGRHGLAVLAAREQLEFDPAPASDCASLFPAVEALYSARIPVRAMRDATRGGVAAVLHEWSQACCQTLVVDADRVPRTSEVRGACELLGLDPLQVACEGTMVVAVPEQAVGQALQTLRRIPVSALAVEIGEVLERRTSPVVVRRALGQLVPLDEPAGSPMPRIC